MSIKTMDDIKDNAMYYVIAFTRIGVITSSPWIGSELRFRLEGFHYEPQYDMWFYPGDSTGYDIRVCGNT